MILDTNVPLYNVQGRLASPLAIGQYMASFITEIEVLSYPRSLKPRKPNSAKCSPLTLQSWV